MRKVLGTIAAAALAASILLGAPPRSEPNASDTPRAAFIKKCIRDLTKEACTAPSGARATN